MSSDSPSVLGLEPAGRPRILLFFLASLLVAAVVVAALVRQGTLSNANGPGPEPQQEPNTWSDQNSAPRPSPRRGHAMAYDPLEKRVVLFGGEIEGWRWLNDTWTYDPVGNMWTNVTPVASPPVLVHRPRLVYDAGVGRVLLFGARDFAMDLQVWEFDTAGRAWTFRSEDCCFSFLREFSVAYDARLGQTILVGGGAWAAHYPGVGSNETWLYSS